MKNKSLAKPVGINHISLVVGNIAEAVAFYGGFLDIEVVYEDQSGIPRSELASIEMGDQFIALTCGKKERNDVDHHVGLVVSDKERVRECVTDLGISLLPGPTFTFLDPWGNRIEIVSYQHIMFTKLPGILEKNGAL
ncbi:hypothetical protein B4901_01200 [Yersinia frederiksenii]|nr:hypothetical protein B4901_01200 [Yersinia frederiksenii]